MYQLIDFHVRGVAPLLMHNKELANPFNPIVKAMKKITSKRKKTEEDLLALSDLEFTGGLYVDDSSRPILPGEMIEATIVAGAKKTRRGVDARVGIFVPDNAELVYEGPKTAEKLREDKRFRNLSLVTVNRAKVLRTRPCFKQWAAKFTVHFLPDVLNEEDIVGFVTTAGRMCAFGDNRPRFGRFDLVSSTPGG